MLLTASMACFVGLLFAAPSYSQPVPTDREIQASGGFFHAQGADVGTASGDISYGYFLQGNRAWEIGLRQGLSYAFIDHGKDAWSATTVPFFNYHFYDFSKDDRLVPFVGGFLGGTWNDDDATGTLGPELGAKYFVNDRTFLRIGYRYEWFFNTLNLRGVTRNRSDGNHVVAFGIGFLFGGK
jgi:hypothetical protein